MNHNLHITLTLLACIANAVSAGPALSITKYGAIGDGKHDSTKALAQAWTDACATPGGAQITIPKGNYWIGPLEFNGQRCQNGTIVFQVDGNLLADTNLGKYKQNWLDFRYKDGLVIKGSGTLDGQGASAWPYNSCQKKWACHLLPQTMSFEFVSNLKINGLTLLNSKQYHMNLFQCHDVDIRNVHITAPGNSPNTDGIHMGNSRNINIDHVTIGTGDDCISIGSDTRNVTITNINCGPGHGISVGSLGKAADKGDVIGLTVKDSTITGTQNGIRIKSWQSTKNTPGGVSIYVKDFVFDNIIMNNVSNPIYVDQEYCPFTACAESEPSAVKLKGIKFKNIRGSSNTHELIKLVCSRKNPCEGVELSNIELKYAKTSTTNPLLKETAVCKNAYGTASNVKPVTCFI